MGDYIALLGGVQIYLSGFRSRSQQEDLFVTVRNRPVARPGCSQHQYGFAVDVAWGLLREESPIGQFSPREINSFMSEVGRILGLTAVERDPGHFQIFPGAQFKAWAVASGFCDPTPVPIRDPLLETGWVTLSDGTLINIGPGFLRVCKPSFGGIVCDFF